jgi:hypothetical protein
MNAVALLETLHNAGAIVEAHGDRLHIEAPAGAIDAELRQQLKRLKPALLQLLAGCPHGQPEQPQRPATAQSYAVSQNCDIEQPPPSPPGRSTGVRRPDTSRSIDPGERYNPALAAAAARRQFRHGLVSEAQRDALLDLAHEAAPPGVNLLDTCNDTQEFQEHNIMLLNGPAVRALREAAARQAHPTVPGLVRCSSELISLWRAAELEAGCLLTINGTPRRAVKRR